MHDWQVCASWQEYTDMVCVSWFMNRGNREPLQGCFWVYLCQRIFDFEWGAWMHRLYSRFQLSGIDETWEVTIWYQYRTLSKWECSWELHSTWKIMHQRRRSAEFGNESWMDFLASPLGWVVKVITRAFIGHQKSISNQAMYEGAFKIAFLHRSRSAAQPVKLLQCTTVGPWTQCARDRKS